MPEPTRINCVCINPDCGTSLHIERLPAFINHDLVHIEITPNGDDIIVSRSALLEALQAGE